MDNGKPVMQYLKWYMWMPQHSVKMGDQEETTTTFNRAPNFETRPYNLHMGVDQHAGLFKLFPTICHPMYVGPFDQPPCGTR